MTLPAPQGERPIYGRSDDLSALVSIANRGERAPATMVVVGSSGVGKSGLLRHVTAGRGATLRHEFRASTSSASNFVNELSRQLIEAVAESGLDAQDLGASLAKALRGNLKQVAAAAVMDGVRAIAPHLSGTIESVIEGVQRADTTSDLAAQARELNAISESDGVSLLLDLLRAVSDVGLPGVVIVDQIERASESAAAAVLAIARALPNGWGLIVATNDETPAGVKWLQDYWPDFAYADADRLELQPLARPAVEEWYLRARGELPGNDELSDVMIWTQGRPLVLAEWIDGKAPSNQLSGVWDRLGPYYAARIGPLPPSARSLLRKLALFPDGTALDFTLIHALTGNMSTQDTLDMLTTLVDGLFLERAETSAGTDAQYAFRHSVIQLHALHGLPSAVTSELATAVLDTLHQLPPMEEGFHAWSIGRLAIAASNNETGPAEALRAGRLLLARGLFIDASELLRDAAETFRQSNHAAALSVAYCDALVGLGRYESALAVLDRLDDSTPECLLAYGRALLRLNRYREAVQALTRAGVEFARHADTLGELTAKRELITIERDLGQYDDAVTHSHELVGTMTEDTPVTVRAAVLRALARSLALSGEPDMAVPVAQAALELAEALAPSATATAHLALGEAQRHAMRTDLALAAYRESARVSKLTGNRDCYLWAVLGAADSLRICGRITEARDEMAEAQNWVLSAGASHPLESLHFGLLGGLLDYAEESTDAGSELRELVEGYAALGIDWPSHWLSEVADDGSARPLPF